MNIHHGTRKREQRKAERADRRRDGEPSERLKPAGVLELSDKLSGEASKDDRYGEDRRRSRHCARHGGADPGFPTKKRLINAEKLAGVGQDAFVIAERFHRTSFS